MAKKTRRSVTVAGKSISNPFLELPGLMSSAFEPPEPGQLRILLAGQVGGGKTTFCCSIPRCLILDLERKASAVPFLGEGSNVLQGMKDRKGLSMPDFEFCINKLVEAAKDGDRPYDTVVIDSVDSLCDRVMDHYTETYKAKLQEGRNYGSFGKDGAGYGDINSWITRQFGRLTRAGYGWIAVTHWNWEEKDVNGKVYRSRKFTGNPGVIKYLKNEAEFIGRMDYRDRVELVESRKTRKDGKTTTKKDQVTTRKYVLDLTPDTTDSNLGDGARQHVPIEDELEMPLTNAWESVFVPAYNEAIENVKKEQGI